MQKPMGQWVREGGPGSPFPRASCDLEQFLSMAGGSCFCDFKAVSEYAGSLIFIGKRIARVEKRQEEHEKCVSVCACACVSV